MANKSKKELTDKLSLLNSFESNLRIMEFELIKKMQHHLSLYKNNLFSLVQNMTLLEKISKSWVNNSGSFFVFDGNQENKRLQALPNVYVLVGPTRIDKFTMALLDKLVERVELYVKPTDFVVTVGANVNDSVKRLGLTIIAHFPITVVEDHYDFLEKISSIYRVLTSKTLVNESWIIYAETEIGKERLLERQILPINMQTWRERLDQEEDMKDLNTLPIKYVDLYESAFSPEVTWFPSILEINVYLVELLIKLQLDVASNKNKYRYYEREYQLLQSKKDKIRERKGEIRLDLNKIRKEQITNDILVLSSAFKIHDEEEEDYE